MSVGGPGTSQLRALAGRLRAVGDALPRMVSRMGTEAVALNRQSFASQQTPDGVSWADGKYTSSPMLKKSGKLASSLRASSDGDALIFGVKISARYGYFHHHGAVLRQPGAKPKAWRRVRVIGPRRRREGPRQRLALRGPRRVFARGFLPSRPLIPRGDVPGPWVPKLVAVADRHMRRALGL